MPKGKRKAKEDKETKESPTAKVHALSRFCKKYHGGLWNRRSGIKHTKNGEGEGEGRDK
jgi:hypothetical protein